MLYDLPETIVTSGKEYRLSDDNNGYDFEVPFNVEFDIQSISNPSNFRFRAYQLNSTNPTSFVQSLTDLSISDSNYHHVKVIVNLDNVTCLVDDIEVKNLSRNFTDKLKVNFTTINTGGSAKVKNMVISS